MSETDASLGFPSPAVSELLARVLGNGGDCEFDAITAALPKLTGCDMAFLSLACGSRLWFKSSSAGPVPSVALDRTFCSETLRRGTATVIGDAWRDSAYDEHPCVRTEPFVRFYAGVPVRIRGEAVGSLCVVDLLPRADGDVAVPELQALGVVVEALIEARLAAAEAEDDAAHLREALAGRDRLHRQLHQAERMAAIGSWRLTVADGALEYSDQVYAIHDLAPGQPSALTDALRFYPEPDRQIIADAVERAIIDGLAYDLELDFVTAKGRARRVRAMAEPEIIAGEVVALIGVFQDVTEHHTRFMALEHQANTDVLTQIGGRRGFTAELDAAVARQSPPSDIALVLIDLDHFKLANDRHGHAAGDEVLQRVGAALREPWLMGSYAARLGGDEFALIVTEPQLLTDVPTLSDRILRELILPVGSGDAALRVTATLGICHGIAGQASRRTLLECADAALYHAKRVRRGTAAIRCIGAAAVKSA